MLNRVYKFDDILNEEKEYDFQAGDKVRCISPHSDNEKFNLDEDEIYTIFKIKDNGDGKIKIGLVEKPNLLYAPSRFRLLNSRDDDYEDLNYEPWYDEDVRRRGKKVVWKLVHGYTEREIADIIRKVDARHIEYKPDEGDKKVVIFTSDHDKRDVTDLKDEYSKIYQTFSKGK